MNVEKLFHPNLTNNLSCSHNETCSEQTLGSFKTCTQEATVYKKKVRQKKINAILFKEIVSFATVIFFTNSQTLFCATICVAFIHNSK